MTPPAPQDDTSATSGDAPWYKDGLRFKCNPVWRLLHRAPGYVWVNQEEVKAIAEVLGKSVGEVRLEHTRWKAGVRRSRNFANGDCTFFDGKTRGC